MFLSLSLSNAAQQQLVALGASLHAANAKWCRDWSVAGFVGWGMEEGGMGEVAAAGAPRSPGALPQLPYWPNVPSTWAAGAHLVITWATLSAHLPSGA